MAPIYVVTCSSCRRVCFKNTSKSRKVSGGAGTASRRRRRLAPACDPKCGCREPVPPAPAPAAQLAKPGKPSCSAPVGHAEIQVSGIQLGVNLPVHGLGRWFLATLKILPSCAGRAPPESNGVLWKHRFLTVGWENAPAVIHRKSLRRIFQKHPGEGAAEQVALYGYAAISCRMCSCSRVSTPSATQAIPRSRHMSSI